MWETSKTPQSLRTARCSGMTPSYWTGISQPAKGTRRAPAAACRPWSGVRRSVCTALTLTTAESTRPRTSRGLGPGLLSRPGSRPRGHARSFTARAKPETSIFAEERGDLELRVGELGALLLD